jgi:Na+/phosphate symporter
MDSKIVILLCLGYLGLFGTLMFLFQRIMNQKGEFRDIKNEWLETQKDSAVKNARYESDITTIKGKVESLNMTHYEDLLKKIATNRQDLVTLEHTVQALDESIKSFYAKWARRLGKIVKEEAEREESVALPQDELEQIGMFENSSGMNGSEQHQPKPRSKGGWPSARR